jgi:hypothetical protein
MDDPKKLTRVVPNPHVDLNNARNLRRIFPKGSEAFFQANETKTQSVLPNPKPKHNKAPALGPAVPGKEESVGRITLRYRHCRVRLLDYENFAGSTKDLTDGLCRCGLLPGDDPSRVTIITEQEKLDSGSREYIDVEIEWPD